LHGLRLQPVILGTRLREGNYHANARPFPRRLAQWLKGIPRAGKRSLIYGTANKFSVRVKIHQFAAATSAVAVEAFNASDRYPRNVMRDIIRPGKYFCFHLVGRFSENPPPASAYARIEREKREEGKAERAIKRERERERERETEKR